MTVPRALRTWVCCLAGAGGWAVMAGPSSGTPRLSKVLIVVAHPDDEITMAATTFRLTQEVGGTVDQVVLTNGEGGFKYATLAQRIYGLALTQEPIGRSRLPGIRKAELVRAGRIMGVRKHFFLEQRDHSYTQDIQIPLGKEWNCGLLRRRLRAILEQGRYDGVFTSLPVESTHGHHKAAAVLALEAAAAIPLVRRPVVLGALLSHKGKADLTSYQAVPGYPITRLQEGAPVFSFDLTRTFGHRNALNYQIISNWVIAEHKSQGTLQMFPACNYELETFRLFHTEVPRAIERVAELFQGLNGASPGTTAAPSGQPISRAQDPGGEPPGGAR